jgi:hypothetical protein
MTLIGRAPNLPSGRNFIKKAGLTDSCFSSGAKGGGAKSAICLTIAGQTRILLDLKKENYQ